MARAKKPFTQKQLFVWLRSMLRNGSRRYPPIFEALADAKRPYTGPNPRQKVCYKCAKCEGLFSAKEVAVDHRVDCGSLLGWKDVEGFVQRLFCTKEDLDVLCHPCHDVKTYVSKHNVSEEEAILQKKVIEMCKKPIKEIVAFCKAHGYNSEQTSNSDKRRAVVYKIISKDVIKDKGII